MRALCLGLLLVACAGCVGPEDTPVKVVDLRVLGVSLSPPEVMTPSCDPQDPANLFALAQPLRYQALVADPAGGGRAVHYTLSACVAQGDRDCDGERVLLAEGDTQDGVLTLEGLTPALKTLPGDRPLLRAVQEADTYKGMAGVRMPLVLHLTVGGEELYAQKLMVYSCKLFPEQEQNENPELPGLVLEGEPWTGEAPRSLQGAGPFALAPLDFSALERPYVVPSLEIPPRPISLTESWRISWHTDYGRIEPGQTGGTDVGGFEGRHDVEWLPPSRDAGPRERVRVWAVVRDGRGGQSWLERSFRYAP